MGKRKVSYQPKSFETSGKNSFTSIYGDMLASEAFRDLTDRQKVLYLYAKSRYYGQTTKAKERLFQAFTDLTLPGDISTFFSLTAGNVTKDFGLYDKNHLSYFYRDLAELIRHGFIRCVACGAKGKVASIYQYSDKWKKWGTDDFRIERGEMTSAMQKRLDSEMDSS